MTPRERVRVAMAHREADRVPRFEIWIDGLLPELGLEDPSAACAKLGQDCVMMPGRTPPGSRAWRTGVDEWGRIWKDGFYAGGAVETRGHLNRYSPPPEYAEELFDAERVRQVRLAHPDHCLIYGTHVGPFTAGYMAMGLERFFLCLADDPAFVERLLDARTEWCIALYQQAVRLGAEVLVLGDDAGHRHGPMISPSLWRRLVLPCHRRIVEALGAPVLWHSDGNIGPLLPQAVEAGFAGVHGLEPQAGMDLAAVKRDFARHLVLAGNVDVGVLCGRDLAAVRGEVDRCMAQGAAGGGYMIATCNSIFDGMNAAAVAELFRYETEVGYY